MSQFKHFDTLKARLHHARYSCISHLSDCKPCLSNESMLPKLALELRLREADVPMLGEGSSCSRKTNEQCNV